VAWAVAAQFYTDRSSISPARYFRCLGSEIAEGGDTGRPRTGLRPSARSQRDQTEAHQQRG